MSKQGLLRTFLFDYDSDNDSLYLFDPKSKSKSNSSLKINNLIIDYNNKNEISGVEILDASDFFNNFSNLKVSKKMLEKILDSKIQIINKGGFLFMRFIIQLPEQKEIVTNLSMPYFEKSSLAISV